MTRENPLFASIADLILGTEQSAALTRRVLRQFPDTLPNNWDDSRFHQDNAWQRNPRQRQIAYDVPRSDGKGNCIYSEYPGSTSCCLGCSMISSAEGRRQERQGDGRR